MNLINPLLNIDELFKAYPANIIGFRKTGQANIIDFWFPNDWDFPPQDRQGYQLKKEKETDTQSYWVLFSEVIPHTQLFSILAQVIEYNLDIQRKQELFQLKINELKRMFTEMSYDELMAIKFIPNTISDLSTPLSEVVQEETSEPKE